MNELTGNQIDDLLAAVGDLLKVAGESVAIVVVGGASLNLLGWVERTTKDRPTSASCFDTGGSEYR